MSALEGIGSCPRTDLLLCLPLPPNGLAGMFNLVQETYDLPTFSSSQAFGSAMNANEFTT